ncbi:MAG: amidohydrolase family protein [Pirellulales bacterium]
MLLLRLTLKPSCLLPLLLLLAAPAFAAEEPNRFENEVARFEEQDLAAPPQPDGVLFVGSSSIRRWNLNESFPNEGFLNRGFGGSQMSDAIHFADRIITPYRPRVVVLYEGDNDLAAGKTPEQIAADFKTLCKAIHKQSPTSRLICIGIKPSPLRWALAEQAKAANELIQRYCQHDSRLAYLDIFSPMLGDDGQPRPDLYAEDRLHLSPAGYALWTEHLRPLLDAARDNSPDLILHHGKIVTVDAQFTLSEAVAIRGDRLLRVGSNDEILAIAGEKTRQVDLAGRTVLPGLIDSHVHPDGASMHEFDHPVPDMESIADVLAYVKSRTEALPEGDWIWVSQIFITRLLEQRFPTKAELDEVAPKHPVVFSTGPDGMANSLALSLSGIDKDFVATGSGSVERDPQTGEPTGILRGGTKRFLKSTSRPSTATAQDRQDRLELLIKDYNSVGLTTLGDRNTSPGTLELYLNLYQQQRLTARVAASHAVGAGGKLEGVIESIQQVARHPLRQEDLMLRVIGIKTFLDGGILTGSAYMRQPWGVSQIYSITDPEYRGVQFIPDENLVPIVKATVEAGLQFTAHATGDGAVHNLLNAYDEVNKSLPVRPTRPCLTHSNFMSAEAVDMMARLGVAADIQPAWLYLDANTLNAQFGYDRLRYFQPLASIFAAGAIAGGGSDHMQKIGSFRSINPYNPFLGMATTITRLGKRLEQPLHPEEALTREQAIRFYTGNNAYILFLDDQLGSLEAGKLADLIVLDRDLLTCPVEEIAGTRVLTTYLGGRAVFEQE